MVFKKQKPIDLLLFVSVFLSCIVNCLEVACQKKKMSFYIQMANRYMEEIVFDCFCLLERNVNQKYNKVSSNNGQNDHHQKFSTI